MSDDRKAAAQRARQQYEQELNDRVARIKLRQQNRADEQRRKTTDK